GNLIGGSINRSSRGNEALTLILTPHWNEPLPPRGIGCYGAKRFSKPALRASPSGTASRTAPETRSAAMFPLPPFPPRARVGSPLPRCHPSRLNNWRSWCPFFPNLPRNGPPLDAALPAVAPRNERIDLPAP